MSDLLRLNKKNVVKWGQGYVVFLTPELKEMGLTDKDEVKVKLVEEDEEKKVIIESER